MLGGVEMEKNSYITTLDNGYQFYDIKKIALEHNVDLSTLPYTIRVLLENVARNSKPENLENNIKNILNWN